MTMTGANNPRGSTWKKWDLHVHTPASQGYRGTYKGLIDTIKKCEADVLGINDYLTFDGYDELTKAATHLGKVLFPVVEFRMNNVVASRRKNAGLAGTKFNFHLIFNNTTTVVDKAKTWLKSQECFNENGARDLFGNISPDDRSNVDFNFVRLLRSLEEIGLRDSALVWLPYDEYGGIDEVDPENSFFKLGLIKLSDIIGSSTQKQIQFFLWKSNKFQLKEFETWFDKKLPCIKGSDAHEEDYPLGRLRDKDSQPTDRYCWIKADPTFDGLKQITIEPEDRVWIGESPPKLVEVERNKEVFISQIGLVTDNDTQEWFDSAPKVPLNHGLVSIIGNKGSGKSALADVIALTSNCHNPEFSFLTPDKFLALPHRIKYRATIRFEDNFENSVSLVDPQPDLKKQEKAIYLSQSFVGKLCDTEGGLSLLQERINSVVYHHIPEEEQLGQPNITRLIGLKDKEFNDGVTELLKQLREKNKEIVAYEGLAKPEFRAKLENQGTELERQLRELKSSPPQKPKEPSKEANEQVLKQIERYSGLGTKLDDQSSKVQKELNALLLGILDVESLLADLKKFYGEFGDIKKRIDENQILKDNGIDSSQVITVSFTSQPITKLLDAQRTEEKKLQGRLKKLKRVTGTVENYLEEMQSRLDAEQRAYQRYLKEVALWEKKQVDIVGDTESETTLEYTRHKVKYIDNTLPGDVQTAVVARSAICKRIAEAIIMKKKNLESIYRHVQDKAEEYAQVLGIPIKEFIEFDSSIRLSSGFEKVFLDYVHQNRKGTFYGTTEENFERLREIVQRIPTGTPDDLTQFPEEILQTLKHNIAMDPDRQNPELGSPFIDDQLKREKLAFYDFVFSLEYFQPEIGITYDGKNIEQLSPGEKGILLLIFHLVIDQDKRPIIIDQPEENLDNETVYQRLVRIIKEAKKKRQIIIVTHNPNLAIVCDAEQLIYAHMDKRKSNLVSYESGSIENEVMKDHALRILEGTKPAFDNRGQKYKSVKS